MGDGTELPDRAARTTALTVIDRSLLVEAGAGSGKTAILAGRVAVLFAGGVAPKNIAAITFTEFAASELRIRIEQFVNSLAAGLVPKELEIAFPGGVGSEQKDRLLKARQDFDQLTCSTIHGFAQALIKPYPVEANIDPGASIIDPSEADLAFGEHVEAWLKEHLSGAAEDDIVAELFLAGEGRSLKVIGELTEFLRKNRTAEPADGRWNKAAVANFNRALASLRRHLDGVGFREADTDEYLSGYAIIGKGIGGARCQAMIVLQPNLYSASSRCPRRRDGSSEKRANGKPPRALPEGQKRTARQHTREVRNAARHAIRPMRRW